LSHYGTVNPAGSVTIANPTTTVPSGFPLTINLPVVSVLAVSWSRTSLSRIHLAANQARHRRHRRPAVRIPHRLKSPPFMPRIAIQAFHRRHSSTPPPTFHPASPIAAHSNALTGRPNASSYPLRRHKLAFKGRQRSGDDGLLWLVASRFQAWCSPSTSCLPLYCQESRSQHGDTKSPSPQSAPSVCVAQCIRLKPALTKDPPMFIHYAQAQFSAPLSSYQTLAEMGERCASRKATLRPHSQRMTNEASGSNALD
jgi:hypothetical protein